MIHASEAADLRAAVPILVMERQLGQLTDAFFAVGFGKTSFPLSVFGRRRWDDGWMNRRNDRGRQGIPPEKALERLQ